MSAPARIQLRRAKGWRMPPNTVKVDRTTDFGNPWTIADVRASGVGGSMTMLRGICVSMFQDWCPPYSPLAGAARRLLRGKNLACWCPLCALHKDGKPHGERCLDCAPCHADVLLEIANAEPRP